MKDKILRGLSVMIASATILGGTIGANAATRVTIKIPALNDGERKVEDTRSGNNAYVSANCHAVYPTGNYSEDNFSKMRVRIRCANTANNLQAMSSEYVLTEGQGSKNISIYNSVITKKKIYFCFYGNSENYNAYADVTYNAR